METNHYNCELLELKLASPDSNTMKFSGYGSIFGNVDSHGDIIMPGAFKNSLADISIGKSNWPIMLINHGLGFSSSDLIPPGVWHKITEDAKGLYVEGELADTQLGRDSYTLMKMQPRAAIQDLSIGYIPVEFKNGSKPGDPRRTLTEVALKEISLVTLGSNNLAKITEVKAARDLSERDLEKLLREVGFSQIEAKIFISKGFKAVKSQREADETDKNRVLEWLKTL